MAPYSLQNRKAASPQGRSSGPRYHLGHRKCCSRQLVFALTGEPGGSAPKITLRPEPASQGRPSDDLLPGDLAPGGSPSLRLLPSYSSPSVPVPALCEPRRALSRRVMATPRAHPSAGRPPRPRAGWPGAHACSPPRAPPRLTPYRGGELSQLPEGLRCPAFHPDGVQFDRGELPADRLDRPLQAAVQPHP